jgi:predicted GTPase
VPCDIVLLGTAIELRRLLGLRQPVVRVHYKVEEIGRRPGLEEALAGR